MVYLDSSSSLFVFFCSSLTAFVENRLLGLKFLLWDGLCNKVGYSWSSCKKISFTKCIRIILKGLEMHGEAKEATSLILNWSAFFLLFNPSATSFLSLCMLVYSHTNPLTASLHTCTKGGVGNAQPGKEETESRFWYKSRAKDWDRNNMSPMAGVIH